MNCLVSTTFGVLDLPRPGFRIIFLSHAILLPHKAKICAQCLQCNGSVDKFGVLSTSLEWRVNLLRRVRSQLCRAHLTGWPNSFSRKLIAAELNVIIIHIATTIAIQQVTQPFVLKLYYHTFTFRGGKRVYTQINTTKLNVYKIY